MMNSLFSSFDPSSSSLIPNWMSLLMFSSIVPLSFWVSPNHFILLTSTLKKQIHYEVNILLGPSSYPGSILIFCSLLILILINNFMGLFPYMFTGTSHMVVTLSLALPMWLSFMLLGWVNFSNHMFAHLVPQGTPSALMSFMVLIESISNIIRPGTLAVRLSANMIAGHLLLTLLGNLTASVSSNLTCMLALTQVVLLTLEVAVSMIQAYVFMVLTSLYMSESSPH